jgi:NAD(P)-dependent dehydrogenase (short-subunit alcohol dehydrogenase family)
MTKRTWFITGINSGFGRLMTEQLLARGDRVAGSIRKAGSVDDLKAAHGDQLWVAHLDVTNTANIREVVSRAFVELGRVDVVVNNAGYGLLGAAEELTDQQIVHQIDTNLIGSMQVARAALPHLRQQGGGRIIQISTMGGQATFPGGCLYHASKWGIEGFMESLRQEVEVVKVSVTIVEPGSAGTDFRKSLQFAPKIDAYDVSPAGQLRAYFASGQASSPGDPAKMAKVIVESVEQSPASRRIALGSDAYAAMHRSLTERLAELESQKELAASTDAG